MPIRVDERESMPEIHTRLIYKRMRLFPDFMEITVHKMPKTAKMIRRTSLIFIERSKKTNVKIPRKRQRERRGVGRNFVFIVIK